MRAGRESVWQALRNDDSGFTNRHEGPTVQAAVAQHAVERFVVTVLPGASRFDEVRVRRSVLDPVLDALGHKLRTVLSTLSLLMIRGCPRISTS